MDQEDYIRKNYKKISSKKIAEKLEISYQKVQSIARKIGVASFSPKIENLVEDVLNEYYNKNSTIKQIQQKLQIGKSTVIDILRLRGKGGRKPHETGILYNCDLDFFQEIDTPEKAYWFGFIAADGNLYDGKLQIRLNPKDKKHLKTFCKRIKFNGPIFKDQRRESDSFSIGVCVRRKQFFNNLKKQGMKENKTFLIDENVFQNIPNHLLNSAYLGYFDGDGSFSLRGVKNNAISLSVLGNKNFLESWCDFFLSHEIFFDKKKIKKDKRTKQTFYITKYFKGEEMIKLRDIFYTNEYSSKDFLDRKRNKLYTAIQNAKT